jgi:hypothetical protein
MELLTTASPILLSAPLVIIRVGTGLLSKLLRSSRAYQLPIVAVKHSKH